jgi:hypothetical protein
MQLWMLWYWLTVLIMPAAGQSGVAHSQEENGVFIHELPMEVSMWGFGMLGPRVCCA